MNWNSFLLAGSEVVVGGFVAVICQKNKTVALTVSQNVVVMWGLGFWFWLPIACWYD